MSAKDLGMCGSVASMTSVEFGPMGAGSRAADWFLLSLGTVNKA